MPSAFEKFRFRVIPLALGAICALLGYFVVPYDLTAGADYVPTLAVTAEQMIEWDGVLGKVLIGSILMVLGAVLALAYSYFELYNAVNFWGKPHRVRHFLAGVFAVLVAISAFQVGGPSLLWLAVGGVVIVLIMGSYYLLVGRGFD